MGIAKIGQLWLYIGGLMAWTALAQNEKYFNVEIARSAKSPALPTEADGVGLAPQVHGKADGAWNVLCVIEHIRISIIIRHPSNNLPMSRVAREDRIQISIWPTTDDIDCSA
jgi:hypothetical protein